MGIITLISFYIGISILNIIFIWVHPPPHHHKKKLCPTYAVIWFEISNINTFQQKLQRVA